MAQQVVATATTACTFGAAPSVLNVLPEKLVVCSNMPAATIMDNKPIVNIVPFGMCTSLANPAVAAATTAALGVLTPMPCTPVTTAPWAPGSTTVLIKNQPALTNMAKCACSFGGVISVTMAGQLTTQTA